MPKAKKEIVIPLVEGYSARYAGKELRENPYPPEDHYGSANHKWERGWYEAEYEIKSKIIDTSVNV